MSPLSLNSSQAWLHSTPIFLSVHNFLLKLRSKTLTLSYELTYWPHFISECWLLKLMHYTIIYVTSYITGYQLITPNTILWFGVLYWSILYIYSECCSVHKRETSIFFRTYIYIIYREQEKRRVGACSLILSLFMIVLICHLCCEPHKFSSLYSTVVGHTIS